MIRNCIFVISQIFIFLGIILLFNFTSQIYNYEYPNHIHKTLYIDRNFDNEEAVYITQAALSWTENTNHIAEIDVVRLPTQEKINLSEGIIILKVSPDYPEILILDRGNNNTTLGYYNNRGAMPCIYLVSSKIPVWQIQTIMTHEIGHALGLRHITGIEGINTLMFPSVDFGADDITQKDLEQFCSLYHCDASKLKLQD